MVQGALMQWLGDLIQLQSVNVGAQDSTLQVVVRYINRATRQAQAASFSREI